MFPIRLDWKHRGRLARRHAGDLRGDVRGRPCAGPSGAQGEAQFGLRGDGGFSIQRILNPSVGGIRPPTQFGGLGRGAVSAGSQRQTTQESQGFRIHFAPLRHFVRAHHGHGPSLGGVVFNERPGCGDNSFGQHEVYFEPGDAPPLHLRDGQRPIQ